MNRRGFLGRLAGGAIAAPSVTQQAMQKASSMFDSAVPPPIPQGLTTFDVMTDHDRGRRVWDTAKRWIDPEWAIYQVRRCRQNRHRNLGDVNLNALKSVSEAGKLSIHQEREARAYTGDAEGFWKQLVKQEDFDPRGWWGE